MKRIIFVAKNNVEVQTIYFDEKVGGKEVIFNRKTYGQLLIDSEVQAANDRKTALDVFDKEVEKAKKNIKLAELAEIQNIMDS